MLKIDAFLARLDNVTETSTGWTAACPAHDDERNSLSISVGQKQPILLYCFAGCTFHEVLAAMNLSPADVRGTRGIRS